MKTSYRCILVALLIASSFYVVAAVLPAISETPSGKAALTAEREGDIAMAISSYSIMLDEYKDDASPEEQRRMSHAMKHAGDLCVDMQRFVEGLEFYTVGYKAAERGGDMATVMGCLGNIGNIYANFEDFERARFYYGRVYRMALKLNSVIDQQKVLINLTRANALSGDLKTAKESFSKLQLIVDGSNPLLRYHSLSLQGALAAGGGNSSASVYYHRKARQTALDNGLDSMMLASEDMQIGSAFIRSGELDSAHKYVSRSLDVARLNGYNAVAIKDYSLLVEISRAKGDSVAGMRYEILGKSLEDSTWNRRNFNAAGNKLLAFEEMLHNETVDSLHSRLAVQLCILIAVVLLLAVVCVATVIIRRRNSQLRFANETLVENNRQLIENEERSKKIMEKYLNKIGNNEDVESDGGDNEPGASEQDSGSGHKSGEDRTLVLSEEQMEILLQRINRVMDDKSLVFDPDFSLTALAQHVKSNTKYVSHVINEIYGHNFKTMLNQMRVREASKRLADSEHYGSYTIQAIGEGVGFRSSNSFINSFKRIVGMTPAVYQKLVRGKDIPGYPEQK